MSKNFPFFGSSILSILLFILIICTFFFHYKFVPQQLPGEEVKTIPAQKISRGEKHDTYPTNPPTSGWYYESALHDGIYTAKIADEEIVAALVNGKVVILYNCQYKTKMPTVEPTQPPADSVSETQPPLLRNVQSLEDKQRIIREINEQNKSCGDINQKMKAILEAKGTTDILFMPYPALDTRVAVIAWGRWDKMFWLDEERMSTFIDHYRGLKQKQ